MGFSGFVKSRTQIKVLEDRYHAEEEERINHQVAMEMELEKKQKLLDKAYKDLNKVQQEIIQVPYLAYSNTTRH